VFVTQRAQDRARTKRGIAEKSTLLAMQLTLAWAVLAAPNSASARSVVASHPPITWAAFLQDPSSHLPVGKDSLIEIAKRGDQGAINGLLNQKTKHFGLRLLVLFVVSELASSSDPQLARRTLSMISASPASPTESRSLELLAYLSALCGQATRFELSAASSRASYASTYHHGYNSYSTGDLSTAEACFMQCVAAPYRKSGAQRMLGCIELARGHSGQVGRFVWFFNSRVTPFRFQFSFRLVLPMSRPPKRSKPRCISISRHNWVALNFLKLISTFFTFVIPESVYNIGICYLREGGIEAVRHPRIVRSHMPPVGDTDF
jgi:hypothetical protein